jgi:molybdopterin/thiamine biosynthesis adenylyltransferase
VIGWGQTDPMSFSPLEIDRYARHLVLREIGGQGQQRLRAARVLIVGAGGLGAPAALYLAAAGVGAIGLADADRVSLSNLQRQVLYRTSDEGRLKVEAGSDALTALNPHVNVDTHPIMLDADTLDAAIASYDLVLDGSDNFETRLQVNIACVCAEKPMISGAIGRWTGQVGLFHGTPCYQCLMPEIPPDADTCAAVGVVGALAGVIGSMMALEAVKWIVGAGESLAGRLLLYDALAMEARTVRITPDPACPVCGRA